MHTESQVQELHTKVRAFFELRGFKVQLKGNPNSPIIIIDDGLWIGATTQGFNLVFFNDQEEVIKRIKLNMNIRTFLTKDLLDLINQSNYKKGYRLKLKGTDLYVVGWQERTGRFMDKAHRYPMFAKYNPLVMPLDVAVTFQAMVKDYDLEVNQWENKNIIP